MKRAFAPILAAALAAAPQGEVPVFRSTTSLVIVNVSVRDKSGQPVEGLKKSDFAVTEDGKPQDISVFEYQRLEEEIPAPAGSERVRSSTPVKKNAAIVPSKPGEIRYRDRRLMVLFFDFASMAPAEQLRAQDSARKFIERQMTPSDLVAVMMFGNSLQVLQDFTGDKDLLTQVIGSLRVGESSVFAQEAETGDTESGQDTGAAFTADESEFNIFNTDRKLAALESAARMLGSLPERKALVYFSSGVGKTGIENQSQIRATVNAAVRANLAFYPVDARGLVATPPGGDASVAAPRGSSIFSGREQTRQRDRFVDQQETLTTLAGETGGKAFLDSNDLSLGIVQAQRDIRSYYIVGYYSTNAALDGKFRRVKVKMANPQYASLALDYRAGYYGAKEFSKFSSSDKERQLADALLLGDPFTDLTLALEADYFRLARDRYFIPVAVKIPGAQVPLGRKGSNDVTEFDFIGQVRDRQGRTVAQVRDGITLKLSEATSAELSRRNLEYDTGFTLPPGAYSLKFLARENRTGKMGTFETRIEVPDLSVKMDQLPLSSVIWSNQREPLSAAVGAAEKQKKLLATHPLVRDGQKLVPSITRVFRRDQTLYVYFEAYNPGTEGEARVPSVAATLSFFRGSRKESETAPVRVTQLAPSRSSVAQFQFQLPLSRLAPGRYTCQVSVIDEIGRRFAFARSPIVVTP
jgi:VWFA-related protein